MRPRAGRAAPAVSASPARQPARALAVVTRLDDTCTRKFQTDNVQRGEPVTCKIQVPSQHTSPASTNSPRSTCLPIQFISAEERGHSAAGCPRGF